MGPYRVILADPPWRYRRASGRGAVANHYATMATREIAALPVAELAAPDAALFLWATWPLLPDALDVMAAWGFTYKTAAFLWCKLAESGQTRMGQGSYTRSNAEVCLLGIRGRMRRRAADVRQVFATVPREHSRKPDEVYSRIERLFTGPYVELFARQQWRGWDAAFSNEAEKFYAQLPMFGEEVGA